MSENLQSQNEIYEDEGGQYRSVYVFPKDVKDYIVPADGGFTDDEKSFGPSLYRLFGKNWREKSGWQRTFSVSEFSTMAHIMNAAGVFKSVSDARKNGWNTPVVVGKWIVGKGMNRRLVVIE